VCYEWVHYNSLISGVISENQVLGEWTGEELDSIRSQIADLDREFIQRSRQWIKQQLASITPPIGISRGAKADLTELSLIRNEIAKQKRHIPIRDLLKRSGRAAQSLKPCFMMSPTSVSQFLQNYDSMFDLVVIDEASQMRPEEAIGAIIRGGQVVV